MRQLDQLKALEKNDLINLIYNDWIGKHADTDERTKNVQNLITIGDTGKAIPYMGWYWRSADFVNKRVTIASDGIYVAVCENNKWGYGERSLTTDEVDTFTGFIDAAIEIEYSNNDGMWSKLRELATWMQTLSVPASDW